MVWPGEVLLGIMQSVPPTPQSLVYIESTANGIGNIFHEEYMRAKANDSDFEAVFIPWFDVDEYQMPCPPDFELDSEERDIKRAFGLTNEQIQWRRYALYSQCRGSVDLFAQEFPQTDSEAFLMSGRPAFNTKKLRAMLEHVQQFTPEEGVITPDLGFSLMRGGPLKVWKRPEAGHDYSIGADPAAGVQDGDNSCAQVYDRDTSEVVATWCSLMPPIPFANICYALGKWYNEAILAPELNSGHGNTMVGELKAMQYPRLYVWQRVDKVRQVITNFLGWETTYRTKQYLIDTTAHAINEDEIFYFDPATIQELIEFGYFDGRRAEGSGKHDDRAMAAMIAFRVHIETPLLSTGIPPRVRYEEFGAPKSDDPPIPPGSMNRDAWEEADEVLGKMRRGHRLVDEVIQPDPQDLEADDNPHFVIDHPW